MILDALLSSAIEHAYAQGISDTIDTVAGSSPFSIQGGFDDVADFFQTFLRTLTPAVALIMIVRAGFQLINSEADDKLSQARTSIGQTIAGVVLTYLSTILAQAIYDGGLDLPTFQTLTLAVEINGVLRFIQSLVGIVGIGIIVLSGVRAVSTFGKEDKLPEFRMTIVGVINGIVLMLLGPAVRATLGIANIGALPTAGDPDPIINEATAKVGTLILSGLVLIAGAMLIYAGIRMVANFGNEDAFNQAKSLIYRVLAGIAVILVSYLAFEFVGRLITGA